MVNMKEKGNLIWGILLIAIGVIIGLNSLGIANINIFFDGWWSLFIIIPSIVDIIKRPSKVENYIWLAVGIALLLCAQGILNFKIIGKLILPVILVGIGLSIVLKDKIGAKVKEKIKSLNQDGLEEYYATFSGQEISPKGDEFTGASLNAIFGGIDLNLTEVQIQKDTLINVTSVFGGVDIKVPSNVNVKVQSTSIFGGVDNKIKKYTENLPTIYVKAFCLFGGADIK